MKKHLNVPLDEELIHRVKLRALEKKQKLPFFVEQALEEAIK